jgi:hypothetical protein
MRPQPTSGWAFAISRGHEQIWLVHPPRKFCCGWLVGIP